MTPAVGSFFNPSVMAMTVAAIMVTFKTMETDELSTNLPNEFKTPDIMATSDMHKR